jgi:hypothetical protein
LKEILCLSLLIATNAYAIDFQKVTGTFDIKEKQDKTVGQDTVAAAAYGSFEMNETGRMPASSAPEVKKSNTPSVNELTGTFE